MMDAVFQFTVTIGGETITGTCSDYTVSRAEQSYTFNNVVLDVGRRLPSLSAARCPTVVAPLPTKED